MYRVAQAFATQFPHPRWHLVVKTIGDEIGKSRDDGRELVQWSNNGQGASDGEEKRLDRWCMFM